MKIKVKEVNLKYAYTLCVTSSFRGGQHAALIYQTVSVDSRIPDFHSKIDKFI